MAEGVSKATFFHEKELEDEYEEKIYHGSEVNFFLLYQQFFRLLLTMSCQNWRNPKLHSLLQKPDNELGLKTQAFLRLLKIHFLTNKLVICAMFLLSSTLIVRPVGKRVIQRVKSRKSSFNSKFERGNMDSETSNYRREEYFFSHSTINITYIAYLTHVYWAS